MKKALFLSIIAICLTPGWTSEEKPKIQIALLLDASGSMDGLIDQAKSRLWSIVNDLATAQKSGVKPLVEVAIFEYGKSDIPASEGHVRMLAPLTSDLDLVSEALFAIKTNGGQEYCGKAIHDAAKNLTWSTKKGDYKAIFIAGNEPFNQGTMDFRDVCSETIRQDILVNTLFCGNEDEGINTHWKEGADLADGQFMVIDQNRAVTVVKAPQDADILRLGKDLNATYVAYGPTGAKAKKRQVVQDRNAASMSEEAEVDRTLVKASGLYEAKSWDLVSAVRDGAKMEDMPAAELPEPIREMEKEERKAWVDEQATKRMELESKLNALKKDRAAWMTDHQKDATLDNAISNAIRKQLKKKSFDF